MEVSLFVHRPSWTNFGLQDRLCSISLDNLGLDPLVLLLFICSIVYRRHGEPRVFVFPPPFSLHAFPALISLPQFVFLSMFPFVVTHFAYATNSFVGLHGCSQAC
ncbi:uncharacterized protein BO72DRAFT_77066 [Aspergillus fijiensis CBS 313.89]|uniref:Transmembrane protein n=1 Tax=Aspergillus fijiensis CBS 313.89 TaxID=1448319 RepID=A0A8G1RSS9_9EURO|nr:uncharacterized protein BO72DRAFT_77066 [Aspergillus fijiensis CBS 313.89]RAK78178.1 hypothetical protein BO72DRAFT_77066 [Aspergillus fijiensis CBS 313.89]